MTRKNIFLLLLLATLFPLSGCAKSYVPSEDRQNIFSIIDEEFFLIKENLNFVEENKDAVWAQSDLEFFTFWIKGLENEKKGMFANAISFYKKAYGVQRYEVSSYEILLPLGRAYILNGEKDKAVTRLKEYLKAAESELSNMRPWELTSEGERGLRKDMEDAEWLISLCK